jgi:uncharacterized cupin superfamily protein
MANLFEPEFGERRGQEGFRSRRAQLGAEAGAEHLGASLYELEPSQAAFPLHYHLANEELLIVISGSPTLRTAAAERLLAPGELVAFPRGEEGTHQIVNRSDDPVRILIVSEMRAPEIVVRPESGKLSALGRPPGTAGEGMHDTYFRGDSVPFWEGESPPE